MKQEWLQIIQILLFFEILDIRHFYHKNFALIFLQWAVAQWDDSLFKLIGPSLLWIIFVPHSSDNLEIFPTQTWIE